MEDVLQFSLLSRKPGVHVSTEYVAYSEGFSRKIYSNSKPYFNIFGNLCIYITTTFTRKTERFSLISGSGVEKLHINLTRIMYVCINMARPSNFIKIIIL